MPTRIQRKRTPGWRKPDNCVIVDRTSRFGNPFRIQDAIEANYSNPRRACVTNFRTWLRGSPEYPDTFTVGGKTYDRNRMRAELHLLRGKDLACTCPLPEEGETDYCHRDDLLLAANDYGAPAGAGLCDQCWHWDAQPDKYTRCPNCGQPWTRRAAQEA